MNELEQHLANYCDPSLGQPLGQGVRCQKLGKQVQITLGFYADSAMEQRLTEYMRSQYPDHKITIKTHVRPHEVRHGLQPQKKIHNMIAVASGKGGVGKSTVSVNLALALAADGAKVGVLDGDIYGPSQPRMLNSEQANARTDDKRLLPIERYGIYVISIGHLLTNQAPAIWRGPMVSQALQQLLTYTEWPALDYLIIDLPPGTGDIQLTLAQKVPVSGAVIVTTPQDIALLDARKGLAMFNKVKVPVLGIIENMSYYQCPACGHEESLFGAHGGQRLAAEKAVDLLAEIPLHRRIREQTDVGKPTVVAEPDSELAQLYRQAARKMALKLAQRPVTGHFPTIQIEG